MISIYITLYKLCMILNEAKLKSGNVQSTLLIGLAMQDFWQCLTIVIQSYLICSETPVL